MKNFLIVIILLLVSFAGYNISADSKIDLSGEWQFRMDPDDRGIEEKWYEGAFSETVQLPGSMVENGKGYDVSLDTEWTGGVRNPEWYNDSNYAPYIDSNNVRFPYWLQPIKKYTGAAWFLKKVTVPEEWEEKTIRLKLERPHWESQIWINGKWVEMQNSLAVPHIFDVSDFLEPGENILAVRIDNRIKDIDPGFNSHSITDHTQSNWNGIVGELSMEATGNIAFGNVKVFPDINAKAIEINAIINNNTTEIQKAKITALARLKKTEKEAGLQTNELTFRPGENKVSMNYSMGDDALLWDEFNPNVYELQLKLEAGKETDQTSVDFGLREIKVDGTRFTINGRPVFLRGTLECAIFPLTGYPATDKIYWRKIYTAAKDHGLNHVRFHSWCPPEAAFTTADEMGIYLQVEASSWPNHSTELGSGLPVDKYIWEESERIVDTYGNHPSFVLMASGNEPGGANREEYLSEYVQYWKEKDSRRVYTSGAGWPLIPENDYHITHREARIQGWNEELKSVINAEPPKTTYDWSEKVQKEGKPIVSHEIGQWCVYPNFQEIEKYTGVLKPKNFEIFRESLNAHQMGHLADSFLLASGKLQALCYKADIEATLRTPGFAGFQLLDLHDFPGQGTALVGVLDPFWEEKGYISPEEYRRYCNSTVPLARLEKRIFEEGETLAADIEVAYFGENPFSSVNPVWQIFRNNEIVAEGTLGQRKISIGNAIQIGEVIYEFQKENVARKLTLKVEIGEFHNSWDMWVYPENHPKELDGIKIVENLNPAAVNYLESGGKVLLSLGKGKVSPDVGGDVGVGFSSIFWNTAWTRGQKPHTLGILCNPKHPALKLFPTEYHSNWQWWDAMSHADAIQLDSFSPELKPIVRIIDDWVSNRRLALLFEVKVGEGSIFVSGVDLVNNIEDRLEARQLKRSLLMYMESDEFDPAVRIKKSDLTKIVK